MHLNAPQRDNPSSHMSPIIVDTTACLPILYHWKKKKRKRDIARNQNLLIFVLQWKWNSMVQHFIISSNIKKLIIIILLLKNYIFIFSMSLMLKWQITQIIVSEFMSVACHSIVSWKLNFVQNDGEGKDASLYFMLSWSFRPFPFSSTQIILKKK